MVIHMEDFSTRLRYYLKDNVAMGEFILKKQCQDLGIDPDDIPEDRIEELAVKIASAAEMFIGQEKSRKLESMIRKQRL